MPELILPAPLWRRLAAAAYDALLLAAIFMVVSMADTGLRALAGAPPRPNLLRAELFLAGFAFCGLFWTRGGQTLGMRAWRLTLRRADGGAVTWLTALSRYAFAVPAWALAPLAVLLFALLDPRRRALHDWLSGTELVLLPRDAATAPPPAPSSSPRAAP